MQQQCPATYLLQFSINLTKPIKSLSLLNLAQPSLQTRLHQAPVKDNRQVKEAKCWVEVTLSFSAVPPLGNSNSHRAGKFKETPLFCPSEQTLPALTQHTRQQSLPQAQLPPAHTLAVRGSTSSPGAVPSMHHWQNLNVLQQTHSNPVHFKSLTCRSLGYHMPC